MEYTLKPIGAFLRLIAREEKVMSTLNTAEMIEKTLKENPEVRLILDIAARARETEGREPPREIGTATGVVAIPSNAQRAV